MSRSLLLFLFYIIFSFASFGQNAEFSGELKKFHKITLTWQGASVQEEAITFKDYRLNVTFNSPSGKTYIVPGYFAADGNAGETSASTGNIWRCHFIPIESGNWSYRVSYRAGDNIAASLDPSMGTPIASVNNDSGNFIIAETDKSGADFRAKGKLTYVGEHYLQWTNNEYFLKLGASSPEVFLEYVDFDNTPTNATPDFVARDYATHVADWAPGNPVWKNQNGKGIIGAVNYLSAQGINDHSFVLDNSYGDADTVYPWVTKDEHYVYDISKLDQWQIVFDHMMNKGLMVHLILAEAENQSVFELSNDFEGDANFADARKIYYRELVARFGYLNAITWNIGEESGWDRPDEQYGRGVTSDQQIAFSDYLKELLYYNDNIVLQNGSAADDAVFNNLTGINNLTGASLQGFANNIERSHEGVLKWRANSKRDNQKWVVSYDRPFDQGLSEPALFREKSLWSSIMAGAGGFEFNITSLERIVQDYTAFETYWENMRYVGELFADNNIPFQEMESKDDLVSNGWCFGKDYEVYVVYLKNEGTAEIDILGDYSVKWYDPRNGGALADGSVLEISSGSNVSIGSPPNNSDLDWVAVLQNIQTAPVPVTGVTLEPAQTTIRVGLTFQLTAQVLPLNATNTSYTFSSSDTAIATITSDGLVKGQAIGTATITVTSDDGAFTANSAITVIDGADFCSSSGTILMERYDDIPGGDVNSLINSADYPNNPSSTTELTEFSIPPNAADFYGARVSGFICAPESGTYYFWITGDDQTELNLSADEDPLNAITIASQNQASFAQEWDRYLTQKSIAIELVIGETYYIEALVKENRFPDHLSVGWRKPSDGPGNLPTEVIPGRVLSPNLESTVPDQTKVIAISVDPTELSIISGDTSLITPMILPATALNTAVSWRSSDTAIAVVDETGMVTAVSVGNAIITVITEDGGYTATTMVTVTPAEVITGLLMNPTEIELLNGETIMLEISVTPTDAEVPNIIWNSSDTTVATVDTDGLVTAISIGNTVITATTEEGDYSATSNVTVTVPNPVTGVSITPAALTFQIGNTAILSATISPADANNQLLIWSSSDSSIVSVDDNGLITAVAIGNAIITVITEEGAFTAVSNITVIEQGEIESGEFVIFPNPASDILNVEMPYDDSILKIEIFDAIGRLIMSVEKEDLTVFGNTVQISVLPLQNSLYAIHILNDKLEIVKIKFIVQK